MTQKHIEGVWRNPTPEEKKRWARSRRGDIPLSTFLWVSQETLEREARRIAFERGDHLIEDL